MSTSSFPDSLQAVYDGFADTYEANRGAFDISAILAGFLEESSITGGHLLDLGCGAGEPVACYFLDRGWSVTGVDFSARMLALAQQYAPAMRTIHADIRQAYFGTGVFDAITATYSLFHVPAADHPALFENTFHWLKPGGRFLFTYATLEYTGSDHFDGYKAFLDTKLYYSHVTPNELCTQLATAGFTLVSNNYHDIGGETFLWVTVQKPDGSN